MKNYKNYVFETVSNPDFNSEFEVIIDNIDQFWSMLDEAFDKLEEYNSQPPKDVATANAGKTTQTPTKPVQNGMYEYTTNSGKTEIVQIVTPETNTNTAEVKPINPPGSNHPAEWSRLKPHQKQPATS